MTRLPPISPLFPYTTLFRSVFCLLKAIEERGGRPPVNFRFLIEGEEEYGSRVLFDLLRREPERTRADAVRSEEHTSELQSQSNLVCRLLLEKKKENDTTRLA